MMPMPADANIHGDVFGGWIMAHVDIAGAIPAARRASGRVATVAVTSFQFKQPVFVGDLVSFYATILKTLTRACQDAVRQMKSASDVMRSSRLTRIILRTTNHHSRIMSVGPR